MHPFQVYLTSLRNTRSSLVRSTETSFYPDLKQFLDAIGKDLTPKIGCYQHPNNAGAGIPDMGLYAASQLRRLHQRNTAFDAIVPEAGVIEVKSPSASLDQLAASEQVARYLERYQKVLVTNYRGFLLVTKEGGNVRHPERFEFAASEEELWKLAARPESAARQYGTRCVEFLKRVMHYSVRLSEPKDVAWYLASYAREAKDRLERTDMQNLAGLRSALEEALGIHFQDEKGERFFRATLVQTLFYGVFSAWVLWSHQRPHNSPDQFNWHEAEWSLHVPMIRSLYHQLASPTNLKHARLEELLDETARVLNRVDRAAFFQRFEEKHAVQYFYEPFLEEFDPELRRELGVWYTPREIVQYMVARVDTALREELGVADGLADRNVYVLDPCCGTGAFLVEVLEKIAETLRANGSGAHLASELKRAAMERVFGFEILPAPFVVAHLQLGVLLQSYEATLDGEGNERAGVYLTNALTGWEPPSEGQKRLQFPEMQEERDAAENVKREKPILVVLGNPPYNGFAGTAVEEERELSKAYRFVRNVAAPQGQGLNDLYVRFFRIAERRIVEKTGQGIVCFISNYSWLDGLSFTGMRERYLEVFDEIRIDSLNGDKYKTGKTTPEGLPDPSVFSTEANREGIQVGTAIATFVRKQQHRKTTQVSRREFWGTSKRTELLASLETNTPAYEKIVPESALGLPFSSASVSTSSDYLSWPLLPELFPVSFPGVKTSRDSFLVDIDRKSLERRIGEYFNEDLTDAVLAERYPDVMGNSARYEPYHVRRTLLRLGMDSGKFVRYQYRPFDVRWLYWQPDTKLLDEKRTELYELAANNTFLISQQKPRRDWSSAQSSAGLPCLDLMDRGASAFPRLLAARALANGGSNERMSNVSRALADFLDTAEAVTREMIGRNRAVFKSTSPVAYEVAHTLHLPLDVFVVRKLGAPAQPELAIGAVASGGIRVLNQRIVSRLRLNEEEIETIAAQEFAEVARREALYRGDRPLLDVGNKTVLLVDDGIATGASMSVAIQALRSGAPAKIIVAVPVAPAENCDLLRSEADDVICLHMPENFSAVGEWYQHFHQTTDDEVANLLNSATDKHE